MIQSFINEVLQHQHFEVFMGQYYGEDTQLCENFYNNTCNNVYLTLHHGSIIDFSWLVLFKIINARVCMG